MSIIIEGGITIESGITIADTPVVVFIACEDGTSLLLTEAGDNLITEN
jgi:hypothetical protein